MPALENHVSIITGASSGIGRAAVLLFAREGAKVTASDIDDEGGEETVALAQKSGGAARFVRADVSKTEDVIALVDATIATYGTLDSAFNNAGIEGTTAQVTECTEDNWDRPLRVNLKSAFLCMKYQIPHMLKRGRGSIVNCASIAGLVGFPNLAAYVASKHGMVGLSRAAALEYAKHGIRVNALCPGVIRTPMVDRTTGGKPEVEAQFIAQQPIGRMGKPEEVAAAALFLCSDASSLVTGQAMAVDGDGVAQ